MPCCSVHVLQHLLLRQIPNVLRQANFPELHDRLVYTPILQHRAIQLQQDVLGQLQFPEEVRGVVLLEPREVPADTEASSCYVLNRGKLVSRDMAILPSADVLPGIVVHHHGLHCLLDLADLGRKRM